MCAPLARGRGQSEFMIRLLDVMEMKSGFLMSMIKEELAMERTQNWKPGVSLHLLLLISVSITGLIYANDDDFIMVVDNKDLDKYWLQKKLVRPVTENAKKSKGGCVAIGFVIGSDGKSNGHQVVARYPDDAPDKIWIDALRRTRYKPAENNVDRTPVYTVAIRATFYPSGRDKKKKEADRKLMSKVNAICVKMTDDYMTQLVQKTVRSEITEK